MSDARLRLGVITKGSLLEGLEMKLDPTVEVEQLRAGQYVVIEGQQHVFYTMITDVRLESVNPQIGVRPPGDGEQLLRAVLRGESTYVTLQLRPLLQLPNEDGTAEQDELDNAQVKTVPGHFAVGHRADEDDVARVFGREEDGNNRFDVGRPLDMDDTPICIDLGRFVERSNGIFGKTGTGKTFLTRLVLAGLIDKCPGEVVTLLFDMHNEYGFGARQEGSTTQVMGLKKLFGERVAVYTLDHASTTRRGHRPDGEIQLSFADIDASDIYAMRDEFGLSEAGCDTVGLLAGAYGDAWLSKLLKEDVKGLAEELGAHEGSLAAAKRKLDRLTRGEFKKFLHPTLPASARRSFDDIVDRLADKRQHVVLEFGNVTSLLAYLLVANVLTRKLYETWVEKSEKYLSSQQEHERPPHLVIAVEEAHKFLNPEAARQTSFGQIARELRKYFVSLLIVDQRPSGIDDEILSQLGTRITAQLNDDRDIQAVLAGTTNSQGLRVVLAGLDSKQQALIFGHAVPMPVVLRTRSYDEAFYQSVSAQRKVMKADVDSTLSSGRRLDAWPSD